MRPLRTRRHKRTAAPCAAPRRGTERRRHGKRGRLFHPSREGAQRSTCGTGGRRRPHSREERGRRTRRSSPAVTAAAAARVCGRRVGGGRASARLKEEVGLRWRAGGALEEVEFVAARATGPVQADRRRRVRDARCILGRAARHLRVPRTVVEVRRRRGVASVGHGLVAVLQAGRLERACRRRASRRCEQPRTKQRRGGGGAASSRHQLWRVISRQNKFHNACLMPT